MWRNVERNLSCGDISPRDEFGDKSVLSQFMLFCYEICFVAIYAVLSQNPFCRNLHAFACRKIELKIVPVEEKRTNIRYAYTVHVCYKYFMGKEHTIFFFLEIRLECESVKSV